MTSQDLQTQQASGAAPIFYSPNAVQPDVPANTPQQTNLPSSKGNFLERNANTIGGIVGGIGGEIIDPFGGGIVGAAAMQGVGQWLKNKATGTNTNPFEEAAIGGASEVAGKGFGKVLAKGALALKGAAPDLFKSAFNVPAKLLPRLKPTETAQKILDYNVGGSLDNIIGKSNSAMDVLDGAYGDSVGQITQPIDINGAIDAASNVIKSPYTTDLSESDKSKILNDISSLGATGATPFKIHPQDAVDSMRQLESVGHTLLAKGENKLNPIPRLSQMGQSYLAAADHIQNQLDKLGASTSVKAVQNDANKAALSEISPKLADEFMQAKSPQEIRSLMAPFYNVKTMAKITKDNPAKARLLAQATGAGAGFGLGGLPGAVAGMVASPVIEGAETALRAPLVTNAAKLLNKVADRITPKAGTDIIGHLSPGDALSQVATQTAGTAAGALLTGPGNPTTPTPAPNAPGSVSSLVSSSINNTIQPLMDLKNGANAGANIPSLAEILQSGGTEGLNAFLNYQKQEAPQLSETQQSDWTKAQDAINAVQDFSKVFDHVQASGAGVGQLEQLGAKIPGVQNLGSESALKAYEDNRGDLASTIAQVLGGGRGSKALLTEIKTEIPAVTDSPQAAAMKLHILVQRLGQHMNTILSAPATNTPGQLANFNGQTVPGTVDFSTPFTAMQQNAPVMAQ